MFTTPRQRCRVPGHLELRILPPGRHPFGWAIILVALLAFAAVVTPSLHRRVAAQENSPDASRGNVESKKPDSLRSIVSGAGVQERVLELAVTNKKQARFVPGEVLVRFRSDALAATKGPHSEMLFEKTRGQFSVRIERVSEGAEIVKGLRLARVAPDETLAAVAALSSRPDVLYAEPNYIKRLHVAPTDSHYGILWGLKNTGQTDAIGTVFSPGTPGADIDAELAWNITTGSRNVVVGVIDQGMLTTHTDLADNIWKNPAEIAGNAIDDDGNGYVDDVSGWDFANNKNTVFDGTLNTWYVDYHGTHVAGTIGAAGNNGGVVGVNWQVSIMPLKFIGGDGGNSADLLKAFNYVRMMKKLWVESGGTKGANIRVLNNSYGSYEKSQAEFEGIKALADAGILFVVSAGNDGRTSDIYPAYPAAFDLPNIISVAATERKDQLARFSNFGARSVHIGAPGQHIWSSIPAYFPGDGDRATGSYYFLDGTSMAAPHVTGTAALICAAFPDISMQRLRAALLYSGDVIPSLENKTVTGRRLNAFGALQNAADVDTAPPAVVTDLRVVSQNNIELTLEWTAPGDDGNAGRAAVYEIRYADSAPVDAEQFHTGYWMPSPLPRDGGTTQRATIKTPFQHTSGFISLRAIDNAGNASELSRLPISVSDVAANPYLITEGASESLSTGGVPLGLRADDKHRLDYPLPFAFPMFGQWTNQVTVSTNGVLYAPMPPQFLGPSLYSWTPSDARGTVKGLEDLVMIAGLWDDIRTDRRPDDDIYVVTPDQDRIIFRWQGVTFDTPLEGESTRGEHPVNFEIELQRNGTIRTRYGDGNTRLFPLVGISGGSADANVIASHSSTLPFKDLTNAGSVTFVLREQPPPPPTDLSLTMELEGDHSGNPADVVISGQNLTYIINITNTSPDSVIGVAIKDPLPAGATFVSCNSDPWPCSFSGGQVVATIGQLSRSYPNYKASLRLTVRMDAPNGAVVKNTATVSSYWPDATPQNNSATATAVIAQPLRFDNIRSVVTGINHTVALKNDGTLWAWGQNDSGQLGIPWGGVTWKPYPVVVPDVTDVAAISAGGAHNLALKNDGSVWGWGANSYGQIGPKTQVYPYQQFKAIQIDGLANVRTISAGSWYSLFIKSDRTLWALGQNDRGQLGTGSFDSTTTPVQVTGLTDVAAVAAGNLHSIAVRMDGTVWTWGNNHFGELGDSRPTTFRNAPFQVPGLTGVTQVDAGENFSLALRNDGTVWAWGRNYNGQLGDGTNEDRLIPVQVTGISNVIAVAAIGNYSMALKADGTVWSWGQGPMRITNNNVPQYHVATQISGLAGVVAIEAGFYTGYAVMGDGTVRALGRNGPGLYGDGTSETVATVPVHVLSYLFVDMPVFNIDGSTYPGPVNVYLSSTEGATIHYTTDGSDPTENDPVVPPGSYVRVEHSLTLKARAWKTGWTASRIKTAAYTISSQPNPIDEAREFVRQQYRDFLNREADQAGEDFWTDNITKCGDPARRPAWQTESQCTLRQRETTSAAFFLSPEFQYTGYYVYRIYQGGLGRPPRLSEFTTDAQFVGNGIVVNGQLSAAKINQNKTDLASQFVNCADPAIPRCSEFRTMYDGLSNQQYVDKLFQTTGVNASASDRSALVNGLDAGTESRASVLQKVVDGILVVAEGNQQFTTTYGEAFYDSAFKRAFVQMEYFGYLRRDPDEAGYAFWLGKLDQFGGNFVDAEMVLAFILSPEYRSRFDQP
ncbi:MAG TPA: S8 family serine peptidase [Pyrinomonadaceae bacterium]|nr:S8 family serine peptidase [Pyrinomonadaceae bacterium]